MGRNLGAPGVGIDRREFLALMSGALAHSVVGRPLRADDLGAELPTFRFRVRRDADLLSLDFRFVNFERRDDTLHALGSGRSRVVVRFPPQNLAEARFDKAATKKTPPKPDDKPETPKPESPAWEEDLVRQLPNGYSPEPPVATYLSGPSWVVFDVPDGTTVPLTPAAAKAECGPCDTPPGLTASSVVDFWLNQMGEWRIRVQTRTSLPLKPEMPNDEETCIEVPFRLFLTPRTETAKWITSSLPVPGTVPHSTAVEHWHAALHDRTKLSPASLPPDILKPGEKPDKLPPELAPPKNVTFQARAAFSPDYDPSGQQPEWARFYPGKLPLSHRAVVRHGLVKQMSEGPGDGWVDAEHLVLAPLGADASLSYMMQKTFREILDAQLANKDTDKSARLAIWKHRMVIGRDSFLLSAWTGFLMPLVIPALFIEVTRRKFASRLKVAVPEGQKPDPKLHKFGPPGAYLITEYYILAPDPVKQFAEPTSVLGLKMPIRKATLLDPKSPLIQVPAGTDPLKDPFIPRRLDGGANVRWPVEFEDINGGTACTDDVCLLFAANVVEGHQQWPNQPTEVKRWRMPGSKVGLAPSVATLQAPPTSETQARPEVHNLTHEERDAAAKLAGAIQDLLGKGQLANDKVVDALRRLGETTASLPAEVKQQADRLTADTRTFMKRLVEGYESPRQKAEDVVNVLVGRLSSGDPLAGSCVTPEQVQKIKTKAETLGRQLRKEIDDRSAEYSAVWEVLQRKAGAIQNLSDDAQKAWNDLGEEAEKWVEQAAKDMVTGAAIAQRTVENALRQLERTERAATDVEMHAIEFGSRRVDKVLTQAQVIRDKLAAFTSRKDFEAWLQGQVGALEAEALERLQGELNALWTGVVNWTAQQAEARRFFDGLNAEADKARAFLRDGFHPELISADVIVPALKAMGGNAAPQELKLLEEYATKGIDGVRNSAFAQFTKVVDDGKAMADRIKCAVAAPAAQVAGLSRDLGAVVGAGQEAVKALARQAEGFDLRKAIPDFKLLGVLPFDKIVSAVLTGAELPTINIINVPDHVEQVWEWNAKLQKIDLGIIGFEPKPPVVLKDGTKRTPRQEPVHLYIRMQTRINVPQPGQSSPPDRGRVKLNGEICYWNRPAKKPLEDVDDYYAFAIQVLKLININFVDLSFDAEYPVGGTPDFKVRPRLGEVTFLPPLDFVKKLQDALPIFGKGFDVVQAPARVGVTYQFQLPAIAFGVFSMRNLAIGSAVLFSLEGKPLRFDFNISSWKEPFELIVLCFGGRGFLKVAADTGGYRDLQGMLEFGGALSFDVVVASGGLYVMGGIYFRISTERTSVSGFLRAGGTLNVLGLIHASVEFLLMMSYISDAGHTKLAGEASVTVSIDLFLVSFDVTIRMYKEFEGSGSGESSSGGLTSMYRDGYTRLASFAPGQGIVQNPTPPVPRPTEAPEAYFARPQSHVAGRFSNPADWATQYWSQFAL